MARHDKININNPTPGVTQTGSGPYLRTHFADPADAPEQRAKAAKAKRKELEEACPKLTAATR
jgi:hypothetical protein